MVMMGVPGTKTFWAGTDNYFLTGPGGCQGCGSQLASKLALRIIFETRPDALVYGRSCGGGRSELQTGGRIAQDGSGLFGMELAMKHRKIKDRPLVTITGEGRTLDMGFGDFTAALDREQKVTFIVLDNESYASSGSHSTPTTPHFATTRLYTPSMGGYPFVQKNVPLMTIHSRARYVATATPAYAKDYVFKIQEALKYQPSYVNVICPCQVGWGYEPDLVVHLSRLVVQTGLSPLWKYKDGVLTRTVRILEDMKIPVQEYLSLQRRFRHVTEDQVKELERYIEEVNATIDSMEAATKK